MPMQFSAQEIIETIRMVQMENLDIRTITMGISLRDCAHPDLAAVADRVYDKICRLASRLVPVGEEIERDYGIPIINTRISVTPIAMVAESAGGGDYVLVAQAMDRAAREVGVNFIGGFSALVHKGTTSGDDALLASIPEALAATERVCASVNVARRGRASTWTPWPGSAGSSATPPCAPPTATASAAPSSWCSATRWTTTPSWPARSTASASPSASSTSA